MGHLGRGCSAISLLVNPFLFCRVRLLAIPNLETRVDTREPAAREARKLWLSAHRVFWRGLCTPVEWLRCAMS